MTNADIRLLEADARVSGQYYLADLCVRAIDGDVVAREIVEVVWRYA